MNQPVAHAELIAAFRGAEAEAVHNFGLIKAIANKGPKAIQAANRRDKYAKKLNALGVDIKG